MPTPENSLTKRREPFNFMLWLLMGGSLLMFTILMLFFGARAALGSNGTVLLPQVFWVSTVVIMLSSVSLHFANVAFKKDQFGQYRALLGGTLALGLVFVVMQATGWKQIADANLRSTERNATGFLYLISGLHLLHILVGIYYLAKAFFEALRRTEYVESFVYSVNPPNQLKLKLYTTFWHFVDLLWLFLFAFLWFQRA